MTKVAATILLFAGSVVALLAFLVTGAAVYMMSFDFRRTGQIDQDVVVLTALSAITISLVVVAWKAILRAQYRAAAVWAGAALLPTMIAFSYEKLLGSG